MIGGVEQGIELQGVTGSRIRGNIFDGVGDGLVVDGAGHATEVTRQRVPPRLRLVHRRAGSGGRRELLGDGGRVARHRQGAGPDQRAALEAGERGGLLASSCDASA